MRCFAAVVIFLAALAAPMAWMGVSAQAPSGTWFLVYTSTPQYDAEAWLRGWKKF